ncbi:MAG: 4Fe-4S binding protein [Thermoflexales bacterium]|nr:4Fe-4S binding protein [Thermoflexales bacterium]
MLLDTLTKLTDHFSHEPLIVNAERCLNARYKNADCHRCAAVCPVEAIHLNKQPVQFDSEVCARCGACVWQCPTEVFAQPQASKSKLRETLQAVGAVPVELRCPQHTGNTTLIPDVTIIQQPQCLADLSPARLIDLAIERPVWLSDLACAACPLTEAHASITRAVNDANRWRAAFNQPRQIHVLTTDGNHFAPPHTAPVMDSTNPPSDRRNFFGFLKKALVETGATVVGEPANPNDLPVPVNQRLPQRLPRERQNLLTVLSQLGQPQDVPLGLATISIELEQCTACGLCAKFCPTGSIRFQANEHRFDLDFIPAACLDCGICMRACPAQAITLTHDTLPRRFIRMTATLLVEGDLVPCAVCQKPTAAHGAGTRCEVCRTVPDQRSLAADFFRSLASNSQYGVTLDTGVKS